MNRTLSFSKKFARGLLLTGLFALAVQHLSKAQGLPVERLSSELGLSQNMIISLMQDNKGFLWVGTKDGLNRYDGYQFKVYRFDPFDTLSISDNYIWSILEDQEGRMWVNTANGLNLFDRSQEIFYRVPKTVVPAGTLLSEDRLGNLWMTGGFQGLVKIELPKGKKNLDGLRVRRFLPAPGNDTSTILGTSVQPPMLDATGAWWIGYPGDLPVQRLRFDPEHQAFRFSSDFSDVPNPNLRNILENRTDYFIDLAKGLNNKIWICAGDTLFCWDSNNNRYSTYRLILSAEQRAQQADPTNCLLYQEDHNKRLWITSAGPPTLLDLKTGQTTYYNSVPESDPMYYGIDPVLEDRGGVIWLGSRGNGLLKYNDRARRFANAENELGEGLSLRGIYKTSEGRVWIGTINARLLWIERQNNVWKQVFLTKVYDPHNIGSAFCFFQIKPGELFVGTEDGLFKLTNCETDDPDVSQIQFDSTSLHWNHAVTKIIGDGKKGMWLACKDALRHYNPATGQIKSYPFFNGDLNRISANLFPTLFLDNRSFLWIGLTEGLWRFDPKTETFRKYQNDPKDPKSISHNLVKTIAADPREPERYLWIGTGGGGLNRFDMKTGVFEKFTEKDGLPDMVIYGILSDKEGNLWMSTNKGISVFNPQKRTFRNFDTADGLQDLEFNSTSYFQAPDGQFFFGGIKGLNAFYPDRMLKSNKHVPEIVITDFKISNKSVSIGEPGSALKQAIPYTNKIVLTHDVKIISFEFAALDFSAPAKNQFACKMEGFDQDWQYLGTTHSATYTNLDPGSYTFRVKGSNNDGVWNEEGAAIEIVILPPWWATWWAYVLYALTGGGILFAFIQLSIRRNQDRAEASRLKELNEAKSIFLSTVSHELRTPLTSIMGFSKIIKKRMTERILPNTDLQEPKVERAAKQVMDNLDIVVSESERLTHLINEVLDLAKIEAGKIRWQEESLEIEDVIERAVAAVTTLFDEKGIKLIHTVEPNLPAITGDNDRLIQVVVNLLSNAVKFTDSGSVRCSAERRNHSIEVHIADTGIGISEKDLEHVFEKFKQVGDDTLTDKPKGTGLGLSICKEIIEHHGGRIWVESEFGKGSIFSFSLPLPQETK